MRPSGKHLYKRVCPSVGWSVRWLACRLVGLSVGPSVTPVQKPRFSAVFGYGEILHWNKWSTNMFWESFHPSVRPSVSPYICHMINTRWDTARTYRCPVGLVLAFLGGFCCPCPSSSFRKILQFLMSSPEEHCRVHAGKWRTSHQSPQPYREPPLQLWYPHQIKSIHNCTTTNLYPCILPPQRDYLVATQINLNDGESKWWRISELLLILFDHRRRVIPVRLSIIGSVIFFLYLYLSLIQSNRFLFSLSLLKIWYSY